VGPEIEALAEMQEESPEDAPFLSLIAFDADGIALKPVAGSRLPQLA